MANCVKKFPKIFAIGHRVNARLFDGPVEISEKLDGSMTYENSVTLSTGYKRSIGLIVNNKEKHDVLTYNEKTHKIEAQPITGWFKNGISDNWLKIIVPGQHGQYRSIRCTDNHKIMVEGKGWIEAGKIKKDDKIFQRELVSNPLIEQILLGTLLGDSSLSGLRFCCAHSVKQKGLLDVLENKVLKGLPVRRESYISGYGSKCE